jgi:hypothetical protein
LVSFSLSLTGNPILITFVRLLARDDARVPVAPAVEQDASTSEQLLDKQNHQRVLSRPRQRWLLLYTLARNPRLARARRTGKEGKTLEKDSQAALSPLDIDAEALVNLA